MISRTHQGCKVDVIYYMGSLLLHEIHKALDGRGDGRYKNKYGGLKGFYCGQNHRFLEQNSLKIDKRLREVITYIEISPLTI